MLFSSADNHTLPVFLLQWLAVGVKTNTAKLHEVPEHVSAKTTGIHTTVSEVTILATNTTVTKNLRAIVAFYPTALIHFLNKHHVSRFNFRICSGLPAHR